MIFNKGDLVTIEYKDEYKRHIGGRLIEELDDNPGKMYEVFSDTLETIYVVIWPQIEIPKFESLTKEYYIINKFDLLPEELFKI